MNKLWQKPILKYIDSSPTSNHFFTSPHNDHFLHATYPLLKKHYSIPHTLRNKIWQFILIDKLAITNELVDKLVEMRENGKVDEKFSLQIKKDIVRSFNGEGSKDKLRRVVELRKGNKERERERRTEREEKNDKDMDMIKEVCEYVRHNSLETADTPRSHTEDSEAFSSVRHFTRHHSTTLSSSLNFPIAEHAT